MLLPEGVHGIVQRNSFIHPLFCRAGKGKHKGNKVILCMFITLLQGIMGIFYFC
jgi:hypothetical protein